MPFTKAVRNLGVLCCFFLAVLAEDPICSKHDYEGKLLAKVIRIEICLEDLDKRFGGSSTDGTYTTQGTTFVRWGRATCESNTTALVYKGYVGGSFFEHKGAAVDYLCLPEDPEWDRFNDDVRTSGAFVYGGEYQTNEDANLFEDSKMSTYTEDARCAVCWTRRSSVLMIPAKMTCPVGWTKEYSGYLAAGHHEHEAGTEYICLDRTPEQVAGGEENINGKLIYIAEARCGSLPCPPYVDGRELTCVVCTK